MVTESYLTPSLFEVLHVQRSKENYFFLLNFLFCFHTILGISRIVILFFNTFLPFLLQETNVKSV